MDRHLIKTAPTAAERIQLFLDAFSAHGGDDAITSIRNYERVSLRDREVTRIMLTASDLREVLDMVTPQA